MGLFNFFRRHKKSTADPVNASKASPEHMLFAGTVLKIIGPTLESFGLALHKTEIEEYATTITFRKDKQYIKISGSTYPTDHPYFYNIILGEGDSEDVREWDWNSIALWRLKLKMNPLATAKEYEFPDGDKVELSISNANKELLQYAGAFLSGDMTLFYETRSEQNKTREPYKIYTPDENGNYTASDDPISAEQKKKYS